VSLTDIIRGRYEFIINTLVYYFLIFYLLTGALVVIRQGRVSR